MRYLPALALLMLCSCRPAPEAETVAPVAPGVLVANVEAEGPGLPDEITGAWATRDAQGRLLDIVLFANGQAVSTRVEGVTGARGQRGFWRRINNTVDIVFCDGWTDRLSPGPEGVVHEEFTPGLSVTGDPASRHPATRVEGPAADFTGIWQLNREPDGTYLYFALRSDGTAFSTIAGITTGRWEVRDGAAAAVWPDGWNDRIERSSGTWQKKSWVGAELETLADLTEARRVGEAAFQISP